MEITLKKQFIQLKKLLRTRKVILIASHEHPDADAVGSSLALFNAFSRRGLKTFCYLPNPPPPSLKFLPGFPEMQTKISPEFKKAEAVFCLDYGDFRRLKLSDRFSPQNIITIDHHLGDQRGEIQIVQPEFSSTAEIVYFLLQEIKTPIDSGIAACLLSGILGDTGVFSNSSTSARALKVTSNLLLRGAPFRKVANALKGVVWENELDKFKMRLFGKVLTKSEFDNTLGMIYTAVSKKELDQFQLPASELSEIPSILTQIFCAKIALFLVEYEEGKIKGSLRADPLSGITVDSVAKNLGGGGHPCAAGFVSPGRIEEVLKKVKEGFKK